MFTQMAIIYSHSENGKKLNMMRSNPSICVQVDDVRDFFHWKSVIAWGNFEELKGIEASSGMRLLLQNILRKQESSQEPSSLEIDFSSILETSTIFRMKPRKITGRYEGRG